MHEFCPQTAGTLVLGMLQIERLHHCLGFVPDLQRSVLVVVIEDNHFTIAGSWARFSATPIVGFPPTTTKFLLILGGNDKGKASEVFPGGDLPRIAVNHHEYRQKILYRRRVGSGKTPVPLLFSFSHFPHVPPL